MTTIWTDVNTNSATWTDLPKPTGSSSVVVAQFTGGEPIGLLLALTRSSIIGFTSIVTSKWSNVAENTTPWTDVPKAL